MNRIALAVAATLALVTVLASAQAPRRAPDPRSMGGGDCRDNPYNCADAPNPLPAPDTTWIEEMTWMDVRDALKAGKTTVIVPTGGMEPNGPWLVTGKHNYVLRTNCDAIARKLGNALCAPIVPFVPEGNIEPPSGHMRSPGTISMREETYQALLTDIAHSLKMHGFRNIIFIGDSGGNQAGQKAVADRLTAQFAGAAFVATIPGYYTAPPGTPTRLVALADEGGDAERWPARQSRDHAQHAAHRSRLGAVGGAREGRQGDDQRRRHLEPRAIPDVGTRRRRGTRGPDRGADQAGDCREEVELTTPRPPRAAPPSRRGARRRQAQGRCGWSASASLRAARRRGSGCPTGWPRVAGA